MRTEMTVSRNEKDESRFQRYRMEVIAGWPDSDYKRAVMAAAQAVLERQPVNSFQPQHADAFARA